MSRCGSAACTSGRSPGDGVHFGFPFGTTYTLAFSRMLYPERGPGRLQRLGFGAERQRGGGCVTARGRFDDAFSVRGYRDGSCSDGAEWDAVCEAGFEDSRSL